MKRNRVSSVITLLIICTFVNGQKGYQCRWKDNPSDEFQMPDSYYSSGKKGALLYCFTNDDSNIYLDMKIKETAEQNRILKSGLTLWIDVEGKSKKKVGVRYPIGSDYLGPRRKPGEPQTTISLSTANAIQLIGFKKEGPPRIPSNNPEGIRGSVRYDNDGNLIYKLIVPVSEIEGLSEGAKKPLTFCIEYGAPPPEIAATSSGIPPGGMGGGMTRPSTGGRGGGGGGRGGGGGMPGGGFSSAPQTQSTPVNIWVKGVVLAAGKKSDN
ncbi:MAG: hypothetical protein ACUVTX_08975 [Bacteroidales bacterium]